MIPVAFSSPSRVAVGFSYGLAGEWMIPVATFLLSLSCGSGIQLWVGR